MSLTNAWEKFHSLILGMAQGKGTTRERLIRAMRYKLVTVEHKDIPDEDMREDFKRIKGDIEENGLDNYINKLTDIEVDELIGKLLSIYDSIVQKME